MPSRAASSISPTSTRKRAASLLFPLLFSLSLSAPSLFADVCILPSSPLRSRYWLYKMEWETGPNGHLSWYYDNAFVWSMSAASFGAYEVCGDHGGVKECQRTPPRQIPAEPMSLVMNTAIGTWNGGQTALDGKHWPAKFFIDYVRVWQAETHIGCDPPDYPTKEYIDKNWEWYGEPVLPSGYDTCPESYPKSAYDNAKAIKARGEEKRKLAAAVKLAQSAPNAPTPEQRHGPITLNAAFLYQKAGAVVSRLPGVAAFTREQPAGEAKQEQPAGLAALFTVLALGLVGGAFAMHQVQKRTQSTGGSYEPAEPSADYEAFRS